MRPIIDWILATDLSRFVGNYGWVWPASESLHFIGLVLLTGTVGMFDMRVLGFARGIPPVELHRLLRWGLLGFGVSVATGIVFIAGTPDQYFFNSAFYVKVTGLLLMGLNAALFYAVPFRAVRALGPGDDAPRAAKICAAISLLLLVVVMGAGRMLTFFRPPAIY
jgi:hypothetical protein